SFKSEKEAFDKAMKMLKEIDVELNSVRLDRYYSFPSYVDKFGETKVYIIPRKNATLRGSWKWKMLMKEFVENTSSYLRQYYKRENSESEFSVDKRWFGWKVEQKREDRIEMAITCGNLCHNLFRLY
ncbi:MAG: ISNCY-like element ISFac3 family transposase, partial [Candidatus Micrarchaeia archaeon]